MRPDLTLLPALGRFRFRINRLYVGNELLDKEPPAADPFGAGKQQDDGDAEAETGNGETDSDKNTQRSKHDRYDRNGCAQLHLPGDRPNREKRDDPENEGLYDARYHFIDDTRFTKLTGDYRRLPGRERGPFQPILAKSPLAVNHLLSRHYRT